MQKDADEEMIETVFEAFNELMRDLIREGIDERYIIAVLATLVTNLYGQMGGRDLERELMVVLHACVNSKDRPREYDLTVN